MVVAREQEQTKEEADVPLLKKLVGIKNKMEKHTVVGRPEDLLKDSKHSDMFSDFEQVRVIIIGIHTQETKKVKPKKKKVVLFPNAPNKKKVREDEN